MGVGAPPEAAEGVGERRKVSGRNVELEDELGSEGGENGGKVYECVGGTGVETPRALASFARRWGGKGARGGPHDGVGPAELGESNCEERSLGVVSGIMVI